MITLYHHGSSVCAAKVRIVLAEKSLPWDGVYVDILRGDQFDPAYMKLNPKAVVPTLVHDGKVIVESSVICEYLDETFPDPPLKPARPGAPRGDAGVDQGGRRISASGVRRTHLRVLPPLHHRPAVAGKVRGVSGKHAAGFGDHRLACAQEGDRASGHGGAAASTALSAFTTAICKRWRTRWRNSPGSQATPARSPTSPWRRTSTASTCSACRKCGLAAARA